jgi:hypothetical protein
VAAFFVVEVVWLEVVVHFLENGLNPFLRVEEAH